ncbi:hypothetical protein PIB30_062607 [Stylosanthes scabra]|uniref:CCHC-type domain-containing protein n=1 Tax=Stylosanthes scabra TaxID=79078 RepID=A0ABU6XL19_9FABA|nr:hypothetical protein [Stylosanthes scabra]
MEKGKGKFEGDLRPMPVGGSSSKEKGVDDDDHGKKKTWEARDMEILMKTRKDCKIRIKDPKVAATKGAPRKGNETVISDESQGVQKRCYTRCGVEGHTRRTCRVGGEEGFAHGNNEKSSFREDSSSFNVFGYGFDARGIQTPVDELNSSGCCRVQDANTQLRLS